MKNFTFSKRIKKASLFIPLLMLSLLFSQKVNAQALSGAYTVDSSLVASSTNFVSISSMATALNTSGVSGPTRITIAHGFYNESLLLGNIPGASATNNIVIDGGDSSQTIISQDGSISYATVVLDSTRHVHIKNMGIRMTKNGAGAAVNFVGNAKYDTLSNCATWVDPNSSNFALVNVSFAANPIASTGATVADNILVKNNYIIGGTYGIRAQGIITNASFHNKFYNNIIDSVYNYGVYLSAQDSVELVGNSINETRRVTNTRGIYIFNSNNIIISSNYIWSSLRGVDLNNSNSKEFNTRPYHISNNMIYSENAEALYIQYLDGVDVWHNSFNSESAKDPAVKIHGTSAITTADYDMRNNILSAKYGDALFTTLSDTSVFVKCDNNLFYTELGLNVMSFGGISYPSLASYRLLQSLYNSASIEVDPTFNSPTDLHIFGIAPYEKGDNSIPIDIDIDGDSRPGPNSSTVDIGADEYIPPSYPFPMAISSTNPELDATTIYWIPGSIGSDFEYNIVPCGLDFSNGTKTITSQDSLRIDGLTANSCYQLYVRSVCDRDTSIWRGPHNFYTALKVPYVEDFETFTPGNMVNPWPFHWRTISYPTSTTFLPDPPRWVSDSSTGSNIGAANTGPI